jgi:periplasmic protein CpxP/Spy
MGGPMGGPSWEHHRRGAGMMFGPGSVERMVNRLSFVTDASSEQKQKMNAIAQRAADDLLAMREKHLAGRKQMRDVLAAPTIDRAKLESLRVEQMKLADDASKRITTAVADIADVLTPAQRAELAKRMDRFGGGR